MDPSAADVTAGLQFALNCGSGFSAFGASAAVSCPTTDNGSRTVGGKIRDKDNGLNEYGSTVQIANVPPSATFSSFAMPLFVGESAILAFTNPTDPSAADTAAGFRYAFDCTNDNTLEVANSTTSSLSCKYSKAGSFTARGVITDKDQGSRSYTAQVTVLNAQQALQSLREQTLTLGKQALSGEQTQVLLLKLDAARNKLTKGKSAAASEALQNFLQRVKQLMKAGVLTAAQGQTLIEVANRVLAAIAVG